MSGCSSTRPASVRPNATPPPPPTRPPAPAPKPIQVVGARDGAATIDASGARAAALDAATGLLSGSGATVTSVTVTADEVVVTVSRRVDPWFPVMSPRTVVETGRARIVTGITQEGQ